MTRHADPSGAPREGASDAASGPSREAHIGPTFAAVPMAEMDFSHLKRRPLSIGATGTGRGDRTYELLASIARGGMGEVFLAVMRQPARAPERVIVKRLLDELRDDHDHLEMFRAEAEVMRRLDHPNIVAIIDSLTIEDTPCLAMEYVHGRSVSQLIDRARARNRRVPLSIVLYVIIRVLRGLDHVHNARTADGRPLELVHRDITPGNLLVSFDGEVKITDFGISKSQMSAVSTTVGIVKGKARYLSPEQILGERATPRSDIFSCACAAIEMVTGEPLFERSTVPKTLYAIVHAERPKIADLLPVRSLELVDALEKALATEPRARHQSAGHLANALEAGFESISAPLDRADVAAFMREMFAGAEESWESEGLEPLELDTGPGSDGIAAIVELAPPPDPIAPSLTRQVTVRVTEDLARAARQGPAAPPIVATPVADEDATIAADPSENPARLIAIEAATVEAPSMRLVQGSLLEGRSAPEPTEVSRSPVVFSATAPSAAERPTDPPGKWKAARAPSPAPAPPPAPAAAPAQKHAPAAAPTAPAPAAARAARGKSSWARLTAKAPLVSSGPALLFAYALGTVTGVAAAMLIQPERPAATAGAETDPFEDEELLEDEPPEPAEVAQPAPRPPPPSPPAPPASPVDVPAESQVALIEPPPATQDGKVDILYPRGARIRINGRTISDRVPVRGLELEPGRHRIEVRRGRFQRTLTVEITPGEHEVIDLRRKRN